MKFVVDGMLGGLARWLRMLGYEVSYSPDVEDNSLLAQVSHGEGTLLTGDKELHQRALARKLPTLLVSANREEERLADVARKFGIRLSVDMAATKCPECGAGLREASKDEVQDRVPAKSLKLYREFWKCENPECAKVYWMGSHWKQINKTLAGARRLVGQEE